MPVEITVGSQDKKMNMMNLSQTDSPSRDRAMAPDVIVYICTSCLPPGNRLPLQWNHGDAHVAVRELPCSGKMDTQYLMGALEGGGRGLCVVTCPMGQCRFAQGNYRAEIRIGTVRRLLDEIGMEPERVELLRFDPGDSPEQFEKTVREAAARICNLGESPVRT